jgi:hypothetical protein
MKHGDSLLRGQRMLGALDIRSVASKGNQRIGTYPLENGSLKRNALSTEPFGKENCIRTM